MQKYESETIISFNDEDSTATVYTCNKAWKKKLEKLAEKKPLEVVKTKQDSESVTYHIPKKWVKVRTPRELTEEQKEKLAERGRNVMAKLHENPL